MPCLPRRQHAQSMRSWRLPFSPRPACCAVVAEVTRLHCSHCLHRRPCPLTATTHARSWPRLRALARERLSTTKASRAARSPPPPSPLEAPPLRVWPRAMPVRDCAIWHRTCQSLVSCGRSAMACTCGVMCQVNVESARVHKFQLAS